MKYLIIAMMLNFSMSSAHATTLKCTAKEFNTYLITHSIKTECDNNKSVNISGEGLGIMFFPIDTFITLNCSNELADLNGRYYGSLVVGTAFFGGGGGEFVNTSGHCAIGVGNVAAVGGAVAIITGRLEILDKPDYWGDFK